MSGEGNPYLITGPALISFSGGRTSAYMLRMILDAHGGTLPDDVHVCFANTGKEREETLRFVHECATRWGVRVRWLEYRQPTPPGWKVEPSHAFTEVDYEFAARNGEPFEAMISHKGYLPNRIARFCSIELKVRVQRDFARSLGWKHWTCFVGLRADEARRVNSALVRNDSGKEPWRSFMPMAVAGDRREDVLNFWFGKPAIDLTMGSNSLPQAFDLGLLDEEGNCDNCLAKSLSKLIRLARRDPRSFDWWIEQEENEAALRDATSAGARFRSDFSYREIVDLAKSSPILPFESANEHDAECGTWCAGDEA